jgi:hypothetical protein
VLREKSDDFYGSRLVATARLHLATVMNGQPSEPFFSTMWKIIETKTYLGYKTVINGDVELKGIKDFIHNSHYGLGVKYRNRDIFIINCANAAVEDRTQSKYAVKFVNWLKDQDPVFKFPVEYYEYGRILVSIKFTRYRNRIAKIEEFRLLKVLYYHHAHLLKEIGGGRKYKSVTDCCRQNLLISAAPKTIKIRDSATINEIEKIAEQLSKRLDFYGRRALIAKLIALYKADEAANDAKLVEMF